MKVVKLNGKNEEYNEKKLERSLFRAGASNEAIELVKTAVRTRLYEGMSTKELFSIAFSELRKIESISASKYDLKNALMRLGATGFPFEEFIRRLMIAKGFSCQKNKICRGRIITHEIDVIAKKGKETLMIECKHYSKPWIGTSIQTALYVYARFLDLGSKFTTPMLATNTKFSPQVITYAQGVHMYLMGWRYPRGESLEENIERFKMYPVTMNRSLTKDMLAVCLHHDMVLLHDLCALSPTRLARMFSTTVQNATNIIRDANKVCDVTDEQFD